MIVRPSSVSDVKLGEVLWDDYRAFQNARSARLLLFGEEVYDKQMPALCLSFGTLGGQASAIGVQVVDSKLSGGQAEKCSKGVAPGELK